MFSPPPLTAAEVKASLVNPQKYNILLLKWSSQLSDFNTEMFGQLFVSLSCVKFYADLLYVFWHIYPFLNIW
jgi:hypothetical protein